MSTLTEPFRVLVAEKIADTGVDMLRERFDVDLGTDWSREDLLERIGSYHGILIRSATKLDAEVIERADNLRGRRPRRRRAWTTSTSPPPPSAGIIVANAPEANTVAAAEHTVALMLALARNIPQAHASLTSRQVGAQSKFGGTEVEGKTLGVLGFGRIGQLVAIRARAFGMRVVAFDPFVSAERFREIGAEKAETPDDVLAAADFITLHLPKTPETQGFINTETLAKCKDGVRIINVARGPLVVDEDLKAGARLRQGRRRRAGRLRQGADHRSPAVRLPQRRRHPAPRRLAPPRRRTARACRPPSRSSPRSPAASSPPPSTSPRSARRTCEVLGPFVPLALRLGRIAAALADRRRARRGRAPGPDRRARHPLPHPLRPDGPVRRAHRGGGQPRQRARRWPRSAGSPSPSAARPSRATTPT